METQHFRAVVVVGGFVEVDGTGGVMVCTVVAVEFLLFNAENTSRRIYPHVDGSSANNGYREELASNFSFFVVNRLRRKKEVVFAESL